MKSEADACGEELDQICVPNSGDPVCIMAPGDVDCPTGGYEEKLVRYAGITDTRTCSCGCEAEPACTNGTTSLQIVPSDGSDPEQVLVADGDCYDTDFVGFIESATYEPGKPIATCAPEGGALGEVTVSEPVTFCCG